MKKFATDIEREMSFLLSSNLKKSLNANDAIEHLSKARNLLENLGHKKHSEAISVIIKKAESVDESAIEVTL